MFRGVIGFDRPTFIPFLNKDRAFLISAQMFYQHLMDYEDYLVNSAGIPLPPGPHTGRIGFQDWEDNVLLTLLIQGNYMNDRLTPQIITAYDTRAGAGAIAPSVEYKPDNNWVFKLGLNLKWANHKGAVEADDNRSANPFPPYTCAPPIALGPDPTPCLTAYSSLGLSGLRAAGPLPLGAARHRPERGRNPVHHPLPVLIARFLTMKRLVILGAAVAGLTGIAAHAQVSDAIIKNAFSPYEKTATQCPGLSTRHAHHREERGCSWRAFSIPSPSAT